MQKMLRLMGWLYQARAHSTFRVPRWQEATVCSSLTTSRTGPEERTQVDRPLRRDLKDAPCLGGSPLGMRTFLHLV